jgi:hypothetical protein
MASKGTFSKSKLSSTAFKSKNIARSAVDDRRIKNYSVKRRTNTVQHKSTAPVTTKEYERARDPRIDITLQSNTSAYTLFTSNPAKFVPVKLQLIHANEQGNGKCQLIVQGYTHARSSHACVICEARAGMCSERCISLQKETRMIASQLGGAVVLARKADTMVIEFAGLTGRTTYDEKKGAFLSTLEFSNVL